MNPFRSTTMFAITAFSLVAAVPACAADIYKSTDDKGHPVYSDRPKAGSQRIVIRSEPSDPDTVQARIDEEKAALDKTAAARAERTDKDRAARAEKEKAASVKKESCQRAQSRARTLANERLVYRVDEHGNRIYPSSEELNAQRAATQSEIEQSCE